jgi:hypothetical protein
MRERVGPKVKSLDIRCEKPGVRFLFKPTALPSEVRGPNPVPAAFNELRTEEISDAADALFYKLKEFLTPYQRRIVRAEFLVFSIISFVGLFYFLGHQPLVTDPNSQKNWWMAKFLSCLVGMFAFSFLTPSLYNHISLETKRNSPSFFVKNREEFAKDAVKAGIGLVIGYLLRYFQMK